MFHPLSCLELLNCLISSVKATVGEHSTICANIQIIRNSANYTFWLSIFSFLLDKFDTGFELGVTTRLRITHRERTLAARKLWKQPGQIPNLLRVLNSFFPRRETECRVKPYIKNLITTTKVKGYVFCYWCYIKL